MKEQLVGMFLVLGETNGDSYTYVTLTIGVVIYKGYFFWQKDNNWNQKMTFSAIGKNNLAIRGSSNF